MPMLRLNTCLLASGIAFGATALLPPVAQASDLAVPYRTYERRESYRPPPPPDPVYVERRYVPPPPPRRVEVEVDEPACRTITRRRIDDWGREIERRIRVCDDGVVERVPPAYGRRFAYEDRPYGPPPPRPPRVIGPDYDDDFE